MTTTKAIHADGLRVAGAVLVAALLLAGLISPAYGKKDPEKKNVKGAPTAAATVDASKLVWPPPPDVTRVKWLAMVSGEDDLNPTPLKKRKKSWMDRMAGVSLPGDSGKPRLLKPYGVAVDSKGLIYVADAGQAAIFVFDLENRKVKMRGAQMLQTPSGIVIDDEDRLFIADSTQHEIFVVRPDGGLEGAFGQDRLGRPVGVAIDNENRFLYVVDAQAGRLVVFDADTMKFLRYIGKPSDDMALPGTFSSPTNVAVNSDGDVYVTDTFNSRVQVFNADGEFVRLFGKQGANPGMFMRPKGIAIDGDDHVYVVDSEFNNVQVFDREGRVLMFFGDRGETAGSFTLATGIAIDRQNRVIVSEQWNGRIQVFQYVSDKEAAPQYEKQAKAEAERAKNGAGK